MSKPDYFIDLEKEVNDIAQNTDRLYYAAEEAARYQEESARHQEKAAEFAKKTAKATEDAAYQAARHADASEEIAAEMERQAEREKAEQAELNYLYDLLNEARQLLPVDQILSGSMVTWNTDGSEERKDAIQQIVFLARVAEIDSEIDRLHEKGSSGRFEHRKTVDGMLSDLQKVKPGLSDLPEARGPRITDCQEFSAVKDLLGVLVEALTSTKGATACPLQQVTQSDGSEPSLVASALQSPAAVRRELWGSFTERSLIDGTHEGGPFDGLQERVGRFLSPPLLKASDTQTVEFVRSLGVELKTSELDSSFVDLVSSIDDHSNCLYCKLSEIALSDNSLRLLIDFAADPKSDLGNAKLGRANLSGSNAALGGQSVTYLEGSPVNSLLGSLSAEHRQAFSDSAASLLSEHAELLTEEMVLRQRARWSQLSVAKEAIYKREEEFRIECRSEDRPGSYVVASTSEIASVEHALEAKAQEISRKNAADMYSSFRQRSFAGFLFGSWADDDTLLKPQGTTNGILCSLKFFLASLYLPTIIFSVWAPTVTDEKFESFSQQTQNILTIALLLAILLGVACPILSGLTMARLRRYLRAKGNLKKLVLETQLPGSSTLDHEADGLRGRGIVSGLLYTALLFVPFVVLLAAWTATPSSGVSAEQNSILSWGVVISIVSFVAGWVFLGREKFSEAEMFANDIRGGHFIQSGPATLGKSGWVADPTGRFPSRYWNGLQWSLDVISDGAVISDDFTTSVVEVPSDDEVFVRGANSHWNSDGTPKKSFATLVQANELAQLLHQKDGAVMNVYQCSTCPAYHVGRSSK